MHLLRTCLLLIFLSPIASALASTAGGPEPIRIGVTPVFLAYQTLRGREDRAERSSRIVRP